MTLSGHLEQQSLDKMSDFFVHKPNLVPRAFCHIRMETMTKDPGDEVGINLNRISSIATEKVNQVLLIN